MPEQRGYRRRGELLGELPVGELEERQGSAITEPVEGVTELLLLATHQVLHFRPGRDQRQAHDVLVEGAGGLLIGRDERVMV
jgi:hypothetical protein